jgi:uncharacterized protein YciI
MKNYLLKLLPSRADFAQTMTDAERAMMQDHVAYWTKLAETGIVVALGPVADPKGFYGIGILQLDDGVDPATLTNGDPAILANAGLHYEIVSMPRLITRASGPSLARISR